MVGTTRYARFFRPACSRKPNVILDQLLPGVSNSSIWSIKNNKLPYVITLYDYRSFMNYITTDTAPEYIFMISVKVPTFI